MFSQSRRQPPATNEKKNKRPDPSRTETRRAGTADVINKAQDAEKITVSTNLVNVDAVVYQKEGRPDHDGFEESRNFAIFVDGVQKEITTSPLRTHPLPR